MCFLVVVVLLVMFLSYYGKVDRKFFLRVFFIREGGRILVLSIVRLLIGVRILYNIFLMMSYKIVILKLVSRELGVGFFFFEMKVIWREVLGEFVVD